jgi:hypothetical protein
MKLTVSCYPKLGHIQFQIFLGFLSVKRRFVHLHIG